MGFVRNFINTVVQRQLPMPDTTEEAEWSLAEARRRLREEVDELMHQITCGARDGIPGRD